MFPRRTLWSIAILACVAGCGPRQIVLNTVTRPQGLVVSGSGEATAPPDIARLSIGVEARAVDAQQATAQVASKMTAVIEALKAAGVAPADIQTSDLSVYYERAPVQPQPRELPTGKGDVKPEPQGQYRVSNMVRATLCDLNRASAVVDAATAAGANQMHGIQFELEHQEALVAQARERAVADAKQNAQHLAQLMGVELGAPISIQDSPSQPGYGGPMMARAEMKSSMPVERGELTVQHTVELVYALP